MPNADVMWRSGPENSESDLDCVAWAGKCGEGHIAANGWASRLEKNGELTDRCDEVLKALRTTVVMRLPPAPEEAKLSALAVADYDGTSRVYPFTCCAIC